MRPPRSFNAVHLKLLSCLPPLPPLPFTPSRPRPVPSSLLRITEKSSDGFFFSFFFLLLTNRGSQGPEQGVLKNHEKPLLVKRCLHSTL